MRKESNDINQVLNLYEVQQEQIQEENKKRKIIPIILIIVGIILITVGIFYNNIVTLITSFNKKEEPPKQEVVDNNKLKCNYKQDDTSLGVNYMYTNSYTFNEGLLQMSNITIVISPLPNRDIATENIRVLSGKYMDITTSMNEIDGIDAQTSLKNNKLTINYSVDYQKADLTKIPSNDLIKINNSLNEKYATIKKFNQENSYLCQ